MKRKLIDYERVRRVEKENMYIGIKERRKEYLCFIKKKSRTVVETASVIYLRLYVQKSQHPKTHQIQHKKHATHAPATPN